MLLNVRGQSDKFVANSFFQLPTFSHIQVEYVWIDGSGENIRSKTRTLNFVPTSIDDFPTWSFDGALTGQTGEVKDDDDDVFLKPVSFFRDPFRLGDHKLVLCETFVNNLQPHSTNRRFQCLTTMQSAIKKRPWFSMEQEFTLLDSENRPFGWHKTPFLSLELQKTIHYCSVGVNRCFGRDIAEAHYRCCLYAGIRISSANSESVPGRHNFHIGVCEGVEISDHLWMARYLLYRVAEVFGVIATLDSKAFPSGVNAKCCFNFSTETMRSPNGIVEIKAAIELLSQTHNEHSLRYDLNKIGVSTSNAIDSNFKMGRRFWISRQTQLDGFGYFKDCRPPSNCDPYSVTEALVRTCCLANSNTSSMQNNDENQVSTLDNNLNQTNVSTVDLIGSSTLDDAHLMKRKPTEPLSIQQRLKHGLLAHDTVEKIANAANKNFPMCINNTAKDCSQNELSSSNSLLSCIDKNLERYLDQNNIHDFLANFDFSNDDWFADSAQLIAEEENSSTQIKNAPTVFQEEKSVTCADEPIVNHNNQNNLLNKQENLESFSYNNKNELIRRDENQSTPMSTISSSTTTGFSAVDSVSEILVDKPSFVVEFDNPTPILDWKLIPLENKCKKSLDYYSRRDAIQRSNVLKELTRKKSNNDLGGACKYRLINRTALNDSDNQSCVEKLSLPNELVKSSLIDQIPHISVTSSVRHRENSSRKRHLFSSKESAEVNEQKQQESEYFLVASPNDPIFYGEPSTSSCSLIKRALTRGKEVENQLNENLPDSTHHTEKIAAMQSNDGFNVSSSPRVEISLLSEFITPNILISPLKPFSEYAENHSQQIEKQVEQSNVEKFVEHKNDKDFGDEEESDGEIKSDTDDELNNTLRNFSSPNKDSHRRLASCHSRKSEYQKSENFYDQTNKKHYREQSESRSHYRKKYSNRSRSPREPERDRDYRWSREYRTSSNRSSRHVTNDKENSASRIHYRHENNEKYTESKKMRNKPKS